MAASKINIRGITEIIDPYYRYTMDKIKMEKRKNVNVITNINNISKDLDRDPEMIILYIKKKLSIPLIYKKKEIIINSMIKSDEITNILYEFIEYFVLCGRCKLPETTLNISEDCVELECKCCSYNTKINNINKNKTVNKFLETLLK